jgi:hypothetical protein
MMTLNDDHYNIKFLMVGWSNVTGITEILFILLSQELRHLEQQEMIPFLQLC